MKRTILVLLIFLISFNTQSQTWEQIQEPTLKYLKEIAGIRGVLHMCKNNESALKATDLIEETIFTIADQNIISSEIKNELLRLNNEETKRTIKEITDKEGDTFYLFNKTYCTDVSSLLQEYINQRSNIQKNSNKKVLTTFENLKILDIPIYEKFDESFYHILSKQDNKFEIVNYSSKSILQNFLTLDIVTDKDNRIEYISSSIAFEENNTLEEEIFIKQKDTFIKILQELKIFFDSPLSIIEHHAFDNTNDFSIYITELGIKERVHYENIEQLIKAVETFKKMETQESIFFRVMLNLLDGEFDWFKTENKALFLSVSLINSKKNKDVISLMIQTNNNLIPKN